jgi:hypothetical protein
LVPDRYSSSVTLTKGSIEELTLYLWGTKKIGHYFCPVCGSTVFGKVQGHSTGLYGVNLRQVEGVDLNALTYKPFDGASLPTVL